MFDTYIQRFSELALEAFVARNANIEGDKLVHEWLVLEAHQVLSSLLLCLVSRPTAYTANICHYLYQTLYAKF